MAATSATAPPSLLLLLLCLSTAVHTPLAAERTTYMVIVDPRSRPSPFPSHRSWYHSLLCTSPSSSSSPRSFIHVYETLLHGFSASLSVGEFRRLRALDGVLAVFSDAVLLPQTTRSPAFLGVELATSRLGKLSDLGSDTVIAVVDTGIWPESPSFSDTGDAGPVPARWRGECEEGAGFNSSSCNRKLVGARYFNGGYLASPSLRSAPLAGLIMSARDLDGHGTHVASVAAGAPVGGAGFQGYAGGTAQGMAPKARIAAYKVCWPGGCLVSDVVAALDSAVEDGVDVISLSLGSASASPSSSSSSFYYLDPLSIALFRATMAGVLVVSSAGNGGPRPGSVSNAPPWVLTVAAGTMDRSFPAVVVLGDGKRVRGTSVTLHGVRSTGEQHRSRRRLRLYSVGPITSPLIRTNLSMPPVEGGVVFCTAGVHAPRMELGAALHKAGAAAMVIAHGERDPDGLLAEPHVIPTVAVGSAEAAVIERYISTAEEPTAVLISRGTELGVPAPAVASFSARGPDPAARRILKPDLLAPGVDVVGAWTGAAGPSGLPSDGRRTRFNVMSGTSMSSPHVSGAAALLISVHRGWSPGEVKSALMTTASTPTTRIRDEYSATRRPAGPFAVGAGQVNPEKASTPGLVYPVDLEDYMDFFICELNYTAKEAEVMTGKKGTRSVNRRCSERKGRWDLNYPGFVLEDVEEGEEAAAARGEVTFYRRLRRVDGGKGAETAVYAAEVRAPAGYEAEVRPRRLRFEGGAEGATAKFEVAVRRARRRREEEGGRGEGWWAAGYLAWRDEAGSHTVTAPMVAFSSSGAAKGGAQGRVLSLSARFGSDSKISKPT